MVQLLLVNMNESFVPKSHMRNVLAELRAGKQYLRLETQHSLFDVSLHFVSCLGDFLCLCHFFALLGQG